jgi:hypothetical protein
MPLSLSKDCVRRDGGHRYQSTGTSSESLSGFLNRRAVDLAVIVAELRCGFGPLSFPQMGFGVINAECFDLDKNRAWLRDGIRQLLND